MLCSLCFELALFSMSTGWCDCVTHKRNKFTTNGDKLIRQKAFAWKKLYSIHAINFFKLSNYCCARECAPYSDFIDLFCRLSFLLFSCPLFGCTSCYYYLSIVTWHRRFLLLIANPSSVQSSSTESLFCCAHFLIVYYGWIHFSVLVLGYEWWLEGIPSAMCHMKNTHTHTKYDGVVKRRESIKVAHKKSVFSAPPTFNDWWHRIVLYEFIWISI